MSDTELKVIRTRLDYLEKSLEKADCALDKRLVGMNEFRQALKDQNNTFITRIEYEAKHELLKTELEKRDIKIESLQRLVFIGVGIATVAGILAGVFLK